MKKLVVGLIVFGLAVGGAAVASHAPANLVIVSQTSSTTTIGWTFATGATSYRLYRNGTFLSTAGASATQAVFGTPNASLSYVLGVEAVKASGNVLSTITVSDRRRVVIATSVPPEPPPAPAPTITQTIASEAMLSGVVTWLGVYDANGDGVEDDPGSVSFFVDGAQVLNEINPPFGDTAGFWNSTTVPDGTHTFRVDAINASSVVVATNSVTATVSNGTPPPAQCADGLDNDGDTLIDMADPGCLSSSDNDETNAPPPPPPPPGGFPDSSNTGFDAAPDYPGSLKSAGSVGCELPVVSNKTYRFCSFGSLAVGSSGSPVANVTFYGCRFKAVEVENALVILFGTTDANGNGITFDYSSFEPGVAAPPTPYSQSYQYGIEASGSYGSFVGKLTVTHSDIWGFGNAINIKGSNQANPQVYRDNYIHDAAQDGGSYHTDGIGNTTDSGNDSYVTIDHNTIVSAGNTNGIAFQRGTYHHFTVTNNLLSGFGFTTAIWATGSHDIIFTGNTYSTVLKPFFGPLYPQSFWTTAGSSWRNNKWLVPSGAAWGNPLHSGWYWMPNTSTIDGQSNPSDSPFVSVTDYAG